MNFLVGVRIPTTICWDQRLLGNHRLGKDIRTLANGSSNKGNSTKNYRRQKKREKVPSYLNFAFSKPFFERDLSFSWLDLPCLSLEPIRTLTCCSKQSGSLVVEPFPLSSTLCESDFSPFLFPLAPLQLS